MTAVRHKLRGRTALVLITLVLASCRPAAALDEAGRCLRDKLRASRVAAAAEFSCPNDNTGEFNRCMERVERRTERLLAAADARAAAAGFVCPGGGEALGVAGPSVWPVRFVEQMADGGRARCNDLQVRAARRFASAYSRCLEAAVVHPGDFESCSQKFRARFVTAWNASFATASCGGASALEALTRLESEVEETAERLQVRCGDGHVGGFEQCDDGGTGDQDGCNAICQIETCGRVGANVRCVACPAGSVPASGFDGCRCDDGFAGEPGACADIDECAAAANPCGDRPCVNLQGTWACAIPCTADAFQEALASCGAPSSAIAFDCTDTVIALPSPMKPRSRDVWCNDLTIDGAGRNIAFELDPVCWNTAVTPEQCPGGLNEDGTCHCPDLDSGDQFLALRGDRNVVRDLTVRGFFDGIPVRGRDNVVEQVRFDRMCDDAFGSVATGVGNTFRQLTVRDGCDKCSENGGSLASTDPDPRVPGHFNAVLSGIDFAGCRTPVRVASSGRFLLEDVRMHAEDAQFPCDGPRFTADGDEAVVVFMRDSSVEDCRRGVRFGRGARGVITDSRIAYGGLRGLHLTSSAQVSVEGTTVEGNGGGRSTENGFGGVAVTGSARVDLGGGELQIDGVAVRSSGENSLCNNLGSFREQLDLDNQTQETVAARNNWWCSSGLPWERITGAAEVEPVLDRAPLRYLGPR